MNICSIKKHWIENLIIMKNYNINTFEGFVIKDLNNLRIKLKMKNYVALHHLKGNDNLFLEKNLLPFIVRGEESEVIEYFPECEEKVIKMKGVINSEYNNLLNVMLKSNNIIDQKEFALSIQGKTKFTGILFKLRKEFGFNIYEDVLKEEWKKSESMILKFLF